MNCTNPNHVIIGADFSSQEIAISAILANDSNYIESYKSADPYFWLAQKSYFIDPSYVKRGGKFYDGDGNLLSSEEQQLCKITRSLFKSLTLGINYGLKEENLANHLNQVLLDTLVGEDKILYEQYKRGENTQKWYSRYDEIKFVSGITPETVGYPEKRKSTFLIGLHRTYYPQYWLFRSAKIRKFKQHNYEMLKDGWFSFNNHKKTDNSVANFPVQGTAATILRKSLINAMRDGLEVVASVHDALYIVSHKNDIEINKRKLTDAMSMGASDVLGEDIIRIDVDVYTTDWENKQSKWLKDEDISIFREYSEYFLTKKE